MNKYDKTYDATLKNRLTSSYYCNTGNEEALGRKRRKKHDSALAKDKLYQNFLAQIDELLGTNDWDQSEVIFVSWSTGGAAGGNCWDGEATPYVSNEAPLELEDLDKILEKVCPNITFIQYKSLSNEVIHTESYTQSHYYGNYDNNIVKYCLFSELYAGLVKRNLIGNE